MFWLDSERDRYQYLGHCLRKHLGLQNQEYQTMAVDPDHVPGSVPDHAPGSLPGHACTEVPV